MSRGKSARAVSELVLIAGAVATLGGTTLMAVHRLEEDPTGAGVTTSAATTSTSTVANVPIPPAPVLHRSGKITQEQESTALARLAATGLPVYCGGHTKNFVALTFDDGPGPYTHYVLKRLRRNRARATFFLVSRKLPQFGDLVAKELQFGTVADHTVTHPNLPALGSSAQEHEIADAQHAIAKKAGRPVELFRPPYGAHSPRIDALAKKHGLVQVLWTADSADSLGANFAGIKKNVIAALKPGAIILMHDNRGQTVRALPAILHAVRRKHLRAVSLPLMLTLDPPTPAQLRLGGRGCGAPGAGKTGLLPGGG